MLSASLFIKKLKALIKGKKKLIEIKERKLKQLVTSKLGGEKKYNQLASVCVHMFVIFSGLCDMKINIGDEFIGRENSVIGEGIRLQCPGNGDDTQRALTVCQFGRSEWILTTAATATAATTTNPTKSPTATIKSSSATINSINSTTATGGLRFKIC